MSAEIVPLAPGRFDLTEAAEDLAEGIVYLVSQSRAQGLSSEQVLDALGLAMATVALEAERPPMIVAANAAVSLVAAVKAGLAEEGGTA